MTIELTILISVISVSSAIFFGLKTQKRADVKEIEEHTRKTTEIDFKLGKLLEITSALQDEMKCLVDRMAKDEKDTEMMLVKFAELEKRVDRIEKGGAA